MTNWWTLKGGADRIANSFCVIGVGRFGSAVCLELLRAGAEVLAIDMNQRAIDALRQQDPAIEARVVDCTDEEALRAPGALDEGTVVVAISEGSQVRQVISRATRDLHEKMLRRVGADRVVYPSKMQGSRLGLELVRPNLLERLRLDDHNSIEEIRVPASFAGLSLGDLNLRKTFNVSVLAAGPVNRLTENPPASQLLQANELLVVMGSSEALEALPSH